MFFTPKIKVDDNHYKIIRQLAKELGATEKEIGYDLIEMGACVIIMARKSELGNTVEIQEVIKVLREKINADEQLKKASVLMEQWFEAGKENPQQNKIYATTHYQS